MPETKIPLPTMPRTGQKLVVLPGGRVAGWVAGSNGNNANSASVEVEVEVEAELGKKNLVKKFLVKNFVKKKEKKSCLPNFLPKTRVPPLCAQT